MLTRICVVGELKAYMCMNLRLGHELQIFTPRIS